MARPERPGSGYVAALKNLYQPAPYGPRIGDAVEVVGLPGTYELIGDGDTATLRSSAGTTFRIDWMHVRRPGGDA